MNKTNEVGEDKINGSNKGSAITKLSQTSLVLLLKKRQNWTARRQMEYGKQINKKNNTVFNCNTTSSSPPRVRSLEPAVLFRNP